MNISSIIIKTNNLEETSIKLNAIDGVEVHLKDGSTIIATIEANSIEEEINILHIIESTKGVISATMHYSYFEDELKNEISNIQLNVPKVLNDNTPIESMKYYGNIYKKVN